MPKLCSHNNRFKISASNKAWKIVFYKKALSENVQNDVETIILCGGFSRPRIRRKKRRRLEQACLPHFSDVHKQLCAIVSCHIRLNACTLRFNLKGAALCNILTVCLHWGRHHVPVLVSANAVIWSSSFHRWG